MVVALYGLAIAMVVGGLWSVVQGAELVVLERGWTMVIAGSVVATGGVLLAGVAASIAQAKRVEAALQRALERMARAGLAEAPSAPPRPNLDALTPTPVAAPPPSPNLDAPAPLGAAPPDARIAVLGAGGLGAAAVAGALGQGEAAAPAREPPPALAEPPQPAPAADPFDFTSLLRDAREAEAQDTAPDAAAPQGASLIAQDAVSQDAVPQDAISLEAASPEAVAPDEPVAPEADDLPRTAVHFDEPVTPAPEEESSRVTIADTPDPDVASDADVVEARAREDEAVEEPTTGLAEPEEDAFEESALEEAAGSGDLAVIGTYTSGGNTYVMFSDGSIQADTPAGRYTFASLDQLKDFIASGGEEPVNQP